MSTRPQFCRPHSIANTLAALLVADALGGVAGEALPVGGAAAHLVVLPGQDNDVGA